MDKENDKIEIIGREFCKSLNRLQRELKIAGLEEKRDFDIQAAIAALRVACIALDLTTEQTLEVIIGTIMLCDCVDDISIEVLQNLKQKH